MNLGKLLYCKALVFPSVKWACWKQPPLVPIPLIFEGLMRYMYIYTMSLSIMGCCFIKGSRIIYQSCLKCFMYFYTITNMTLPSGNLLGKKGSSKHLNRDDNWSQDLYFLHYNLVALGLGNFWIAMHWAVRNSAGTLVWSVESWLWNTSAVHLFALAHDRGKNWAENILALHPSLFP